MNQKKPNPVKLPRWLLMIATAYPIGTTAIAQDDEPDDGVYDLTPFVVQPSEDDIGYRAGNTLVGSRLNTNIGDIAASISVITKEQMEDTASVDVNDLFRYEASTEGSSTYTPGVATLRNDGVADVNAGFAHGGTGRPQTNASANTVRGLGSPDSSIDFYRAISQIPLDSYNVQSVEISRGPNSMLFGIGSPAGFVNQSRTSAVLNNSSYSLQLRLDDRGSTRASFSFNKPLVEDKLAFFGAAVTDNKRFEREPSYDDTNRFYGTFTYTPFEKTTITASFENYDNSNRRPNTLTPRDMISGWKSVGSPMYDPISKMITYDSGEQVGPFITHTGSPLVNDVRAYIMGQPGYDASLWDNADLSLATRYNGVSVAGSSALTDDNSALYVPTMNYVNARPTMQIANGQVVNWFQGQPNRYRPQYGTAENPAANADFIPANEDIYANPVNAPVYEQFYAESTVLPSPDNIGSYRYPGITDQSIYDWTSTNVLQMNFGEEEAQTYNLEFEQSLTKDLHFSAGWFRQDFESYSSYTVSQLNVTSLFVDTNTNLPDGTPNPYAGGVYVADQDPDRFQNNTLNDQYRAILAYTPDFTANEGWTRWLGRHQFIGFASREEETRDFYRLRLNFTDSQEEQAGMVRFLSNPNNNADGSPTGYRNEGAFSRRAFYLTQPNTPEAGIVNTTSGEWNNVSYTGPLSVYNFGAEAWQDVSYTGEFKPHSASTGSAQTKIDSWNIGGTSYFWDERIVTTYGIRNDKASNRSSTFGNIFDSDGNLLSPEIDDPQLYTDGRLNTDLYIRRYRPWTSVEEKTSTIGGVFKPFSKWQPNNDNLFSQFVQGFGFTYNESETFNPPTSARVDLFGTELPKPGGSGKDYGIQFSLFDNKLFARISRYESSNDNEQISGGTSISRFTSNIDELTFREWARTITLINQGQDPTDTDTFGVDLTPAQEDQLEAEAEVIWGQPYDYYTDLGDIGATRSVNAEGTELQVTFNPLRNWTFKLTGSKQETIYSNVLKEFSAWRDLRFPDFENARAADYLLPEYQDLASYTTIAGRNVDLTNFLQSFGYVSQVRDDDPDGNTTALNYYNNIVTPQVALATDLEGQVITNQSKYQASLLTNYRFIEGGMKGFSVGGGLRWLDKKSIGYFGRSSGNQGPDFLDISDVSRPIFTPAQTYVDLWAAYSRKIMDEKIDMKVQLNVGNVTESGDLQIVGVNYDGSPHSYRIIDPRTFKLTLSFDM